MIKLPLKFRKRGFDYKIIDRTVYFALLEQKLKGMVIGYNVIKVLKFPKRLLKYDKVFKTIPPKEGMPSPEKFGCYGFTFNQYENALEFFETIKTKGLKQAKALKQKPDFNVRKYI